MGENVETQISNAASFAANFFEYPRVTIPV